MAPNLSTTHEFDFNILSLNAILLAFVEFIPNMVIMVSIKTPHEEKVSMEIQKNKLKTKYPILLILASLPFRYFNILAFMTKPTKFSNNH